MKAPMSPDRPRPVPKRRENLKAGATDMPGVELEISCTCAFEAGVCVECFAGLVRKRPTSIASSYLPWGVMRAQALLNKIAKDF